MKIVLVLANPNCAYFSGKPFAGKVIIDSEYETIVEHIYVLVYGKAVVGFEFGSGIFHHGYSANEDILQASITLAGNNGKAVTVAKGLTEYSFATVLPGNLPSSICSDSGKIEYHCLAKIQRSRALSSVMSVHHPIAIRRMVDLNKIPKANIPFSSEWSKTRFWSLGKFKYCITLPRSGFAPGEHVPLIVEMDNQSGKQLYPVATLIQKIYHQGQNRISTMDIHYQLKVSVNSIGSAIGNVIEPGRKTSWMPDLLVKQVPASFEADVCKIINIKYILQVQIKQENTEYVKINIPIVIGLLPIRDLQTSTGWNENVRVNGHQGSPALLSSAPPPEYTYTESVDLLPPTYEEAVLSNNLLKTR